LLEINFDILLRKMAASLNFKFELGFMHITPGPSLKIEKQKSPSTPHLETDVTGRGNSLTFLKRPGDSFTKLTCLCDVSFGKFLL
jgi:hypothetical protein